MPDSTEQGQSPQPINESPVKSPETASPGLPKKDGRANNGGKRPGAGLKKGAELSSKRTYDPHALAEVVASKLLTGGKIIPTPKTGPITEDDRNLLARIAGVNVETFNEMFSQDLREVSVLATARMKEALLTGSVKTGELAFMMTSATDKRLALDGSRALQTASVNIQVNNYGATPKESLLADLDGLSSTKIAVPA